MPLLFSFAGEDFEALPCGALHWPGRRVLLVADLHLEKASHFARAGWPLPPTDSVVTLERLAAAVMATGAETLVALGDSFHDAGGPGRLSVPARAALAGIAGRVRLLWVAGNHDGLSAAGLEDALGEALGGEVMEEMALGPLVLRHEAVPGEVRPELSGHFHPKVTVRVRGRSITRRCFAVTRSKIILPAYGSLAGGLDVTDPAIAMAAPGALEALVADGGRLLRFPVRMAA